MAAAVPEETWAAAAAGLQDLPADHQETQPVLLLVQGQAEEQRREAALPDLRSLRHREIPRPALQEERRQGEPLRDPAGLLRLRDVRHPQGRADPESVPGLTAFRVLMA